MSKQDLLERVEALIDQTQRVDFQVPEDTGQFPIDSHLVRQVRRLMHRTGELLAEIMAIYEAEEEGEDDAAAGPDAEALKEIGARISIRIAAQEITGMAFVSRGRILEMTDGLDRAIEQRELWKVASRADGGLRAAGRALIAIEAAIREYEGMPARYRCWQSIDDALEIRRLYGQFRRAILGRGTPRGEELRARLRSAANRIAILRKLDIYPFMRIDDRLEIRRLQKRILAWLAGFDDGTEEAGARLWQDLESFARLLAQINHREELREHDRLAVNGVYRRLFESPTIATRITAEHLAILEPLLGRDDELDQLILHPSEHHVNDLKAPLERLRKLLGQPFAGSLSEWSPGLEAP